MKRENEIENENPTTQKLFNKTVGKRNIHQEYVNQHILKILCKNLLASFPRKFSLIGQCRYVESQFSSP